MRIGILTVPFNNNYGGFLQAFALKRILQEMGHDVLFLMRKRNRASRKIRIRNLVRWLLGRTNSCEILVDYHIWKISKYTREFKSKYLKPISKSCYTSTSFDKVLLSTKVDVFIAGSDQCWRYKYAPGYVDEYFFKALCGTGRKRISYAASFGVDTLEYDEKTRLSCEKCLREFSAISVRESSAIPLLEKYFAVPKDKAVLVLDPTFLPDISLYKQLIKEVSIPYQEYLFSYILDETEESIGILELIKEHLMLTQIGQKAQTDDIMKLDTIEPVELWLARIYNASFVFTDSYHGMLFSIIFNKPFIVYGNRNRGNARFDNILSLVGLKHRYIESINDINSELLTQEIDWHAVNKRIDELKKNSINFITENLALL